VLGLVIVVLLRGPLLAQEPTPTIGQADTVMASPQPFQDQQASSPPRRELSNVPDDVGYQLQESLERIDAIFPFGPLTPLHNLWDRSTGCTRESIGLDLGLNYTSIYQRADTTVNGPRDVGGGDLDFFGRWHLLGCENHWPGSIVFNTETRHKYSTIPPSSLDTGAVGGTIVGFGIRDLSAVQLYWEQGSYDDGLIYRIGEMAPDFIYDGGRYVSSNYAFFSPAFSDTLPMALPAAGLGFAGAVYPTKSTYVVAGIHDANGDATRAGFDTFFGEGEYFTAVEFGWFPFTDEPNEGMYHVTLWHTDARQNAGKPSDRGVAVTLEQPVGSDAKFVPFLRYAYGHRGLNGIRQNLSIGLGIEDVFGQNDDVIGLAGSWQEPSDGALRDQYVIEAFYRFYITPHTHLSPDIQVIIDPANAPTKDAVTVFGLRLRTPY
jgi:porin